VLREGFAELLENGNRKVLETEVLPDYVAHRRWFGGKEHAIRSVRIRGWSRLPGAADELFAEIEVVTPAGATAYALPLAADWDYEPSGPYSPNLALGRVRRGSRVGRLTDAFATPAFARAVLAGLRTGARLPCSDGELCFEGRRGLDLPHDPALEWIAAEQSNSTVVIENLAVLKLLRKIEAGVHPEAEMTRVLSERGFRNAPPLLGEVRRIGAAGEPHTLMVVQGYVDNQGDAWGWTLDYLERVADDLAIGSDTDAEPAFSGYETFARNLGRRLAEMHGILAQPCADPAFAPEPARDDDVRGWTDSACRQLDRAFIVLEGRRLDHAQDVARVERLLSHHEALRRCARRLAEAGNGSLRTRIHGDLHLGQVLVTGGDAAIIDFEGEPARPLSERRSKHSPLRDVAGVLRSFDYAAAAAERGMSPEPRTAETRTTNLLLRFRQVARRAFLEGYAESGGDASSPLLDLFLLEKAAYEVCYEASSRPAWLEIPMHGLCAIADHLLPAHAESAP